MIGGTPRLRSHRVGYAVAAWRALCRRLLPAARRLAVAAACASLSPYAHAEEWWSYTVRPNDTLWSISQHYLLTPNYWQRVMQFNGLDGPEQLKTHGELRIPASLLKAHARVIWKQGAVELLTPTNSPRRGTRLFPGDAAVTGPDASLAVEFPDGTRLVLEPNSTLIFEVIGSIDPRENMDSVLRLVRGRLENQIAPQVHRHGYHIITMAALTTAYRGRYRLATSGDHIATLSEVLNGTLVVNSVGAIAEVAAGHGTRTEIGRAPEPPRPLPSPPDLTGLPWHVLAAEPLPLRWTAAKAATYHAQLASDSAFTNLVRDAAVDDARVTWSGLPSGNYFVRVRVRDASGIEGLDATHRFRVTPPLHPPRPVAPGENAQMARLPLWFTWAIMPGSSKYRLQVAADPDFNQTLVDIPSVTSYVNLGDDMPSGTYYWRIAAVDRGGLTGTFSTPRRFEVGGPKLVQR